MNKLSEHTTKTCSCCQQPVSSVSQTLEEMDFERGIWSAAVNGDTSRVNKILSGGGDPNVPDSSSFTALVRHFSEYVDAGRSAPWSIRPAWVMVDPPRVGHGRSAPHGSICRT